MVSQLSVAGGGSRSGGSSTKLGRLFLRRAAQAVLQALQATTQLLMGAEEPESTGMHMGP